MDLASSLQATIAAQPTSDAGDRLVACERGRPRMTASARWPVASTHVDMAEIAANPARALGESYLCVFWRDDAPVGQVYGTSGPGELARLDELAARAGVGLRPHASAPKPPAIAPTVTVVICTRH